MAIDLKKLQEMLNRVLMEETAESFEAWLKLKGYAAAPSQGEDSVEKAAEEYENSINKNWQEDGREYCSHHFKAGVQWQSKQESIDDDAVTCGVDCGCKRFKECKRDKIDFTDTKQMAEDCWLFLTNNPDKEKAKIKKEAFLHEVGAMLESVKQASKNIVTAEKRYFSIKDKDGIKRGTA